MTCPRHDRPAETKIPKPTLRRLSKVGSAVLNAMALHHCSLPQSRLRQALRRDRQLDERAAPHSARNFLIVPLQDRSHVLYPHLSPRAKKTNY